MLVELVRLVALVVGGGDDVGAVGGGASNEFLILASKT